MDQSSEWHNLPVFMYGTLKKGEANHYLLEDDSKYGRKEFLGQARLCDAHPMVVASPYNIPFLLDLPGQGHVSNTIINTHSHVIGELYRVDRNLLTVLDQLEGHPDYYIRVSTKVQPLPSAVSCNDNGNPSYGHSTREESRAASSDETCIKSDGTASELKILHNNEDKCVGQTSKEQSNCSLAENENLPSAAPVECEVYLMRNFKQSLLSLPFLEEYNGAQQRLAGASYVSAKNRPKDSPTSSYYVKN